MKNIFDVLVEWGEKYYEANRDNIQKRIEMYGIQPDREDKV